MNEKTVEPTTLDRRGRPLRDLRISVTDRCNLRCSYCMPAEEYGEDYGFASRGEILTFEEVERVVSAFAALGVRKLRITGGEPLLRAQLHQLIAKLNAIDGIDDIAITTNGLLLESKAGELAAAGLRRVTVSLDSLDTDVARTMSGRESRVDQTLAGISAAKKAGLGAAKINCVVQRGVNDHTILELLEYFRGSDHIVRLIEFMDVGTRNGWRLDQVMPLRELIDQIDARFPIEPVGPNYIGEVARRYQYKDGAGEIGIIASVTAPFCTDCQRARVTTDGSVYNCLFASEGLDLRSPIRAGASDDELRALIGANWNAREDRYSELRGVAGGSIDRVEMNKMGG